MSKKKAIISALALVMVCAISIAGTLAYLGTKANDGAGIKNTFIAMGEGEIIPEDDPSTPEDQKAKFEIVETPVTQKADGTYEKNSTASQTTSGIDYKILPGSALPKDSTVFIKNKTDVPCYLYVEVKTKLTADVYEWSVDTTKWKKIDGVKGLNGGDIYVYVVSGSEKMVGKGNLSVSILKDNKVTVKSTATESTLSSITSSNKDYIQFYAYLAQASAGTNAKTAFQNCSFAAAN